MELQDVTFTVNSLSDDWENAECVTSLYSLYKDIKLRYEKIKNELERTKKENMELKEKIRGNGYKSSNDMTRELQQLKDMYYTSQKENEKLDRRCMRQEQHLTKATEKLQQKEAEYQEFMKQMEEKKRLDPHQHEREAYSIRSLQSTISVLLKEKQEQTQYTKELEDRCNSLMECQKKQELETEEIRIRMKQRHVESLKRRVIRLFTHAQHFKLYQAFNTWKDYNRVGPKVEPKPDRFMEKPVEHYSNAETGAVVVRCVEMISKYKVNNTLKCIMNEWHLYTKLTICRRSFHNRLVNSQQVYHVRRAIKSWSKTADMSNNRKKAATTIGNILKRSMYRQAYYIWVKRSYEIHLKQSLTLLKDSKEESTKSSEAFEKLTVAYNELLTKWNASQSQTQENIKRMESKIYKLKEQFLHFVSVRHKKRTLRKSFYQMILYTKEKRAKREELTEQSLYLQAERVRRCLRRWRATSSKGLRARQIITQTIKKLQYGTLYRCMNEWIYMVQQKKEKKMRMRKLLNQWKNSSQQKCFVEWKEYVLKKKDLKTLQEKRNNLLTHHIWERWWQKRRNKRGNRAVVHQTILHEHFERQISFFQKRIYCKLWIKKIRQRKNSALQTELLQNFKDYQRRKSAICKWKQEIGVHIKRKFLLYKLLTAKHRRLLHYGFHSYERSINYAIRNELSNTIKTLQYQTNNLKENIKKMEKQSDSEREALQLMKNEKKKLTSKLLEKFIKLMQGNSLGQCFKTWREHVVLQVQNKRKIRKLVAIWRNRTVAVVFLSWKSYQQRQKELKNIILTIGKKKESSLLRDTFICWKEYKVYTTRKKDSTVKLIERMRNLSKARCFDAWKIYISQRKLLREKLEFLMVKWQYYRTGNAFCQWKDITEKEKEEEIQRKKNIALHTTGLKVFQLWEGQLSRYYFIAWKVWTKQRKIKKTKLSHFAEKRKQTIIRTHFQIWDSYIQLSLTRKEKLRSILRKKAFKELGSVFSNFRNRVWNESLIETNLLRQELLRKAALLEKTQNELNSAREALENVRKEKSEIKESHDELLSSTKARRYMRRCFTTWREFVLFQKRMSDKMRKTLLYWQNRTVGRIYSSWRNYTQKKKRLKLKATDTRELLCHIRLIRFVQRWKKSSEHRIRVKQTYHFVQQNSVLSIMKKTLIEWKSYVQKRKMARTLLAKLIARKIKYEQQYAFRQWYSNVRLMYSHEKLILERAKMTRVVDAFMGRKTKLTIATVFSSWKHWTTSKSTLHRLTLVFQQKKEALCILQWRQYTIMCHQRQKMLLCCLRRRRSILLFSAMYRFQSNTLHIELQRKEQLVSNIQQKCLEMEIELDKKKRELKAIEDLRMMDTASYEFKQKEYDVQMENYKDTAMILEERIKSLDAYHKKYKEKTTAMMKRNIWVISAKTKEQWAIRRWRNYLSASKQLIEKAYYHIVSRSIRIWAERSISTKKKRDYICSITTEFRRRLIIKGIQQWSTICFRKKAAKTLSRLFYHFLYRRHLETAFRRWMCTFSNQNSKELVKKSKQIMSIETDPEVAVRAIICMRRVRILYHVWGRWKLRRFTSEVRVPDNKYVDHFREMLSTFISQAQNFKRIQDLMQWLRYPPFCRDETSAVLFFVNLNKRVLWTYDQDNSIIEVPYGRGLLGNALMNQTATITRSFMRDRRFNLATDQYCLNHNANINDRNTMLCYPIVSSTGANCAVLQVVLRSTNKNAEIYNLFLLAAYFCQVERIILLITNNITQMDPEHVEKAYSEHMKCHSNYLTLTQRHHRIKEELKKYANLCKTLQKRLTQVSSKRNEESGQQAMRINELEDALKKKTKEYILKNEEKNDDLKHSHSAKLVEQELRTTNALLSNSVVKAEADNLILVQVIKVMEKKKTNLPIAVTDEVNKICARLTTSLDPRKRTKTYSTAT